MGLFLCLFVNFGAYYKHVNCESTMQKNQYRLQIYLLVLFLIPLNAVASAFYDYNAQCISAYNRIVALNFNAGRQIIEEEKRSNPGNMVTVLLENYIDFLTLGIGEEKADFERLKPNRSNRISLLAGSDDKSPWHRHSQAAIYLQWSFARVRFGQYMMAGLDLNRAYRLLNENQLLYPGFVPDLLLSGVLNALLGSVPDQYNWALRLTGIDGAIETGRGKLYELIEIAETNPNWSHLQSEAYFYLSFIEMNLQSDSRNIRKLLERMESGHKIAGGALNCYIRANLSMRIGLNDHAIHILKDCTAEEGSYPFHYLDFVLGNALLNRLDFGAAGYFLSFVNRYSGLNYVKSAYQRLAWISLIKGDLNGYNFYISKITGSGQAFVDEDKQAEAEATSGRIPNRSLLKARLLFDGGYYEEAINVLDAEDILSGTALKADSVEYLYRKARIYHEWGKPDQAKAYYVQTIEAGSQLPDFYAGNSALQLGLIYENEDDYIQAGYYYELCRKMRFTEYRSSIQHKARVGQQRIREKKKPAE